VDVMTPDVMTPQHPQWDEFCSQLDQALDEGCEGCGHPEALTGVRRILAEMGVDVERSVAFLEERGGHCPDEILMNVEAVAEEG
jgi:hypothetical protein